MRNRITQPRDTQANSIGDAGFIGVNSRLDPSMVPPGYVSEAINCRFRNGVAETRKGFVILPWMNKIPKAVGTVTRAGAVGTFTANFPHGFTDQDTAIISGFSDSNYNGTKTVTVTGATTFTYSVAGAPATPDPNTGYAVVNKVQPWGTVYGLGEFKDPITLVNYTVIAADSYVYFICENNSAWQLTLPSGVTITDTVTFTQCYDTLIMFRGASLPPLAMPSIATGFQNITQTAAGDGAEVIPPALRGLFFQNRLFIPKDNDEIAVSDFNDYTRYQPVVQELKVNIGSSDSLVNLAKFNDTTFIAFKESSIYGLSNIYGNLLAAVQDQITDQFGLVAAESVAHCGADLLFLSQMGVMSLRQTEQNKIQSVTLPLSDPIQPLIDRINWKYAANAVAAYWDNKYYLAVPLDSAEVVGDELLGFTFTAHGGSFIISPLTVGKTYRYTKGTETSITHNSVTYTHSVDFVAVTTTATLNGIPLNEVVTASFTQLLKGVNNAILVYDFLNQAWAGYDEAEGLSVKRFHIRTKNNVDRLFVVTSNGHILLYEEDYADQLTDPYTDLEIAALPSFGVDTIRVNGGTTISSINTSLNGAASNTWGCSTVLLGQDNLFTCTTLEAGFYPGAAPAWTAPTAANTQVIQIPAGVRFRATNGVVPVVTTTGTFATVTQNTSTAVLSTIVTRGYSPDDGADLSDFDWLCLDVQTWNPDYAVTLVMDGVLEDVAVASVTKDRTKYTIFGRAAYNSANPNLDSELDHREDYSVLIGTSETATQLSVDDSEVKLTHHQQHREQFKVRQRGRSARVKLESSQGRFRLMACKLENRKLQTKAGSKN